MISQVRHPSSLWGAEAVASELVKARGNPPLSLRHSSLYIWPVAA